MAMDYSRPGVTTVRRILKCMPRTSAPTVQGPVYGDCKTTGLPAQEICDRIMSQVASFAAPGALQDDRTLMVVRFLKSRAAMTA